MEVGSIIETAGNLKMMIFNMGISLWIADRFQDSPYRNVNHLCMWFFPGMIGKIWEGIFVDDVM